METNCLLYFPKSQSLVSGMVDDSGNVFIFVPSHGGGIFELLQPRYLDIFNVSIYPG